MSKMFSWRVLDSLLRGDLSKDQKNPVRALLFWQVLLAAFYGACLGIFALTGRESGPEFNFLWAAAAKLPVLIVGTTVVTFPSLYVFLALFNIRMGFKQMAGVVLAANTILATVIASLGPILAFFSFTSSSYWFILLLNVAICGLGGVLGIRLMLIAIGKALPGSADEEEAPDEEKEPEEKPEGEKDSGDSIPDPPMLTPQQRIALREQAQDGPTFGLAAGARGIMVVWLFLYAFVGTQMAWILRPFIGHPDTGFSLFRGKAGSFIDTVMHALGQFFSGGGW